MSHSVQTISHSLPDAKGHDLGGGNWVGEQTLKQQRLSFSGWYPKAVTVDVEYLTRDAPQVV